MTSQTKAATDFDFHRNGDVFSGADLLGRVDSDGDWMPNDEYCVDESQVRHVLSLQVDDDAQGFFDDLEDYHKFLAK